MIGSGAKAKFRGSSAPHHPQPGHPYIGPEGGEWADPQHTIHWQGTHHSTASEKGKQFSTGHPVSIPVTHRQQKTQNFGSQFGQDIEPKGRYVLHGHHGKEGTFRHDWGPEHDVTTIHDTVNFQNPLVIQHKGTSSGPDTWKRRLSDQYGGKTGKALSRAIQRDGHDGVVTVDSHSHRGEMKHSTNEIVDLTGKRASASRVAHLHLIGKTFNFEVGQAVWFGKYKNKSGIVKGFKTDAKGNPIVVVEPVPKGRKKDREIQLFRIWKKKASLSPSDVHDLADSLGIKWDNDATFLEWSQKLTNKKHLDDMTQSELKTVMDGLRNRQAMLKVADRWLADNAPEPTNPYLNTPPTVLRRMVGDAKGKDKELITCALNAYVGTHSWLAPDLRAFV